MGKLDKVDIGYIYCSLFLHERIQLSWWKFQWKKSFLVIQLQGKLMRRNGWFFVASCLGFSFSVFWVNALSRSPFIYNLHTLFSNELKLCSVGMIQMTSNVHTMIKVRSKTFGRCETGSPVLLSNLRLNQFSLGWTKLSTT